MSLVLASGSPTRAALIANVGLAFERCPAEVDERALEARLAGDGLDAGALAAALADAKALEVSERRPGALVIGADQTLALGSERLNKPGSRAAAHAQILRLAGRTHELHAAVSLARDGAVLFRHLSSARLSMRPLTPAAVDRYLDLAGDGVLGSVGAYAIEGPGLRLFDAVDGDHFTILGLPLLPLLAVLRTLGEIDP